MLIRAQQLLFILYVVMPAGIVFWAVASRGPRRFRRPLAWVITTFLSGMAIAIGLILLNGFLMGAHIPLAEDLRLAYICISAVCIIKLLDRALMRAIMRAARVRLDLWGRPLMPHQLRPLLALLVQRAVLLAIVVPYIASLLMTYRPKVLLPGDPSAVGLRWGTARFTSSDGIRLTGWWIPAPRMPSGLDAEIAQQWGRRTVLLCHGVGGGKETQIGLAVLLNSRGFNVLDFDFRAHGESGGNFISYGDRERLDVLAAVEWIARNHPDQAERIFGIGINTGAAALLAAAADPATGQRIDALVLYEPFARLGSLADLTAERTLPRGINWLVKNVGLPMASLHAGADLRDFSPIAFADQIWPRPIMVVHGRGRTFVPFGEEMDLYQQMPQPKEQFWPADNYGADRAQWQQSSGGVGLAAALFRQWLGTRGGIWEDAGVQFRTIQFLREAQRQPVL